MLKPNSYLWIEEGDIICYHRENGKVEMCVVKEVDCGETRVDVWTGLKCASGNVPARKPDVADIWMPVSAFHEKQSLFRFQRVS